MKYSCKVLCTGIRSRSTIITKIKIEARNSKRTKSKTRFLICTGTKKTRFCRPRMKSNIELDVEACSTPWYTNDRPKRKVMLSAQLFGKARKAGSSS